MLFLSVAAMGAFLFLGGGLMIVSQSGLARAEKQSYYSKRAKQKGDMLVNRLANYLEGAGVYTNTAKLSEIFMAKSLNLNEFPESFRTGVKRIRITDPAGAVIFSTMGTLDNGNVLSPQVTALAQQGKFTVFTPNRDTFAALTKYDDPLSLQQKGYILFEFNTTAIFQDGLGEVEPVVRVENGVPLLVIKDNPQATYQQIAAFDLYRSSQGRAPLTGLILSVPYMGNVVYYMGDNFYFPPWLSLFVVFGCALIVGGLYFYLREQGESVYASSRAGEVKNLISDINKGKSYPRADSFTAIDKTSKYGSFPENDLDKLDLASILNEEAESNPSLVKEESVAVVPERKEFVFESIDDEIPSFDFDPPPSLEELHQEDEYTLRADEEPQSIGAEFLLEEEALDPQKDAVEDAFGNISEAEDPNEESNASLAMLMDFPESPEQETLPSDKSPLERYEEHLDMVQSEFGISRRAKAHNNQGLFLLEDESFFGPLFQITAEDPIFQELLSEGKVLSLSGSLEESQYISSLVVLDILDTLSDLFIIPILDDAKSVSDIIVLGRDKGHPPLTVEDKQYLFSY